MKIIEAKHISRFSNNIGRHRGLLIRRNSSEKRSPSVNPSRCDCARAGLNGRAFNLHPTPFCSTKAVYRFSTPSPLPLGITLDSTSDRPPRSGGNAIAHIAGQEFAIRVCRAHCPREPTASFPLLKRVSSSWRSCLVSCQVSCQIGPIAGEIDGCQWQLSVVEHVKKICQLNLKSRTSVCVMHINACKVGSKCNKRMQIWAWYLWEIKLAIEDGNV